MSAFTLLPGFFAFVLTLELAGWAALLAFPQKRWANFWLGGIAIPQVLSLLYIYLLLTFWFLPPLGQFARMGTLPGVYALFENHGLLLVAVVNIVAMNLFAAAWMTRRAVQTEMPRYLLTICLVVTFAFSMLGFLVFAVAASIRGRWSLISIVEEVPPVESRPVVAIPIGVPQVVK
jgi:hypothetical protein